MPEDAYRFKPTPEMQEFGQCMAHIIGANIRSCSTVKGEQKAVTLSASPTKAEVVAGIKDANTRATASSTR